MTDAVVDDNRRRLSPTECVELLARPVAGVFCTLRPDGSIHAVPVFYRYAQGDLRVLAGVADVKTRNAVRTGQATLCVEVIDGPIRNYVSVSGTVTTRQPPPPEELLALDKRYGRSDFTSGWDASDLAACILLILKPVRWTAWSDWD